MWKMASNAIAGIRSKKNSAVSKQVFWECSDDDEVCSEGSRDEELECPICWESFNIVENIPYVLWCGHSLCKNCVLGLQGCVLKVASCQIRVPIFIFCPWCHQLSLRVVYKGNLKFPSKNFILLWMVESFNCNEGKLEHSFNGDNQPVFSRTSETDTASARLPGIGRQRWRLFLHKHLDYAVHLIFKFLLVVIFVVIVIFVIPGSALILLLYLLITLLFALPSLFIFYLALHALEKLMSDITS
ncbi:uncharacterized protein LOC111798304 [Cucurbita pepo subsp. pepo]|uniref:uncharacterized protein LOC111798304 n=1 Tax=Cucurbita pepo subsp. pepo TaxID=3664 RepID=UPI000C9D7B33|nr:uncharacterized protein LOC111798304 [Cucurbita pepo subsp. pepo]XP_023537131.1 uncharacterized protein LOC111798304 [Cucurbita pepo subsp. pepo]